MTKENSLECVTYYFSYHEDGRDALEEGYVHPSGDVSSKPSEAVAPLLRLGGAGLRGNLGREVCHDNAAYAKMGSSEIATPKTSSWKQRFSLQVNVCALKNFL